MTDFHWTLQPFAHYWGQEWRPNITLDSHHVSWKHAVLVSGWQAVSVVPLSTKMLIQIMSSMHFTSRHKALCTAWQRNSFILLIFSFDIIYTQQVFTDCLRDCSITWYVARACCCRQKIIITHEQHAHHSQTCRHKSWHFHARVSFVFIMQKSCILFSFIRVACKNHMVKL